jgi:8-oxo-dGTP pyrophosphatase MutT (NUDIX family)
MSIKQSNVVQYKGNKAAGAIIYSLDTNKFLLARRGPNCDNPLVWGPLGGGVEAGESPEGALKRELWEEAEFNSKIKLVKLGNDINGTFEYITYLGFVAKEFVPILNAENTEYKWFLDTEMIPLDSHLKFKAFWKLNSTRILVEELVGRHNYLYNQSLKSKEFLL